MKRAGNLWGGIASFEALLAAYHRAARGKRYAGSCLGFTADLEGNLLLLRSELEDGTYRPGPYRTFTVYEPKPRLISAAPFRDRVVHHALHAAVAPVFERSFVFDSYATRVGKGTHRCLERFHGFLRESRFVLKLDVEKYFPSVDHAILKALVRRKVKCRRTLALVDLIIDGSNPQEPRDLHFPGDDLLTPLERRRGIPIGNLTSQLFANVYLDPVDHFVKESLHCRRYVRYMDDLCLFADDKETLRRWRGAVKGELAALRLVLKPGKSRTYRCDEGVEFLGFRVFPTHRRVNTTTARRAHRRIRWFYRALDRRAVEAREVRQRLASWLGHAKWANTRGLLRRMLRRPWRPEFLGLLP